ncbi:MAG: hypothetical protein HFF73_12150 [Oscillospiraceae bacterium]|nr:hypothetical protein [Oscillospiraceae bacterium]
MDKVKEKLHVSMEYNEVQTVPLALHEMHMARYNRLVRWLCVAWALSMVFVVGAFVWLWNQYDYESSNELSGVYNLVDSQGNVVSADLEPDDVIRILQELENGKDQADQNQN